MYNPTKFKSFDTQDAFDVMDGYPFATLISKAGDETEISHLPLTPLKRDGKIEVIGHMARANSHWQSLGTSPSTAVFLGPHTFISPKWYARDDVPTWNYSAVHVRGVVDLIESPADIAMCLEEQVAHMERLWPSGWNFFIPDNLKGDQLARAIIGFRIHVETIDFKKKMSQNRSAADREGVVAGLLTRTDDQSHAVRQEMLKIAHGMRSVQS